MINKLILDFQSNNKDISLFLEIVKYYRFNNNFIEAESFIEENFQFKNDDRVQFELANIYNCINKIKVLLGLLSTFSYHLFLHDSIPIVYLM